MKKYSFYDFQKDFPDDNACLTKVMELRYEDKPVCRKCGKETKYHRIRKRRAYACQFCGNHIYPCKGTPFEKSTTPLHKWFYAIYLFTSTRHGVSAKELERQLGVTYKCAWRMAHELRKLMSRLDINQLFGDIEADETYVGGKRKGKPGRGAEGKTIVFGIKKRDGEIKTQVVSDAKRCTIEPLVRKNVKQGSRINTDEWWAYKGLSAYGYDHKTVSHGIKQWVKGNCHTNSMEGYWSMFKRSVLGTHIHISGKHMPKYLGEFDFRHNTRKVPHQMFPLLLELLREEPVAGA